MVGEVGRELDTDLLDGLLSGENVSGGARVGDPETIDNKGQVYRKIRPLQHLDCKIQIITYFL